MTKAKPPRLLLDSTAPSSMIRARCERCGWTASLDCPVSVKLLAKWTLLLEREHRNCTAASETP